MTIVTTIKQKIIFDAPAKEVYALLMDSKKHAAFTEGEADISTSVGGTISAYDGYIEGKNIELSKNKKIVQEWRASDWPAGITSIATFEFKEEKGKTTLTFTQTGVPDEQVEDIDDGWHEHYWEKMKRYLKKHQKQK